MGSYWELLIEVDGLHDVSVVNQKDNRLNEAPRKIKHLFQMSSQGIREMHINTKCRRAEEILS